MTYKSSVTYARYMGRGKMFSKGKVYKLKIHDLEMNWFEKMIYGITGKYRDLLKVKVSRIRTDGVGPSINYMDEGFFKSDWKIEPNWYDQSQNRKK
jgi:hypothetical protein